jgi:hypothetical protein
LGVDPSGGTDGAKFRSSWPAFSAAASRGDVPDGERDDDDRGRDRDDGDGGGGEGQRMLRIRTMIENTTTRPTTSATT